MDKSLIDRMANYSPDFEWPAATLTDELVTEIEDYLQSVATQLAKDFPAPGLRTTADAANSSGGPLAYIVYFYNGGKSFKYARYDYNCENLDGVIKLNSANITKNGKVFGFIVDGKVTNKGYGDLAHELFHAIQRTTRVGRTNCHPGYGDWINEAQAEAFGHDMARKFRNKTVSTKKSRWGGRNSYAYDLYVKSRNESNIQHDRAYQTSSFWRYLAEAWHLRNTAQVSGGEKPGPDMSSSYDTDYGYIASLMDQPLKQVGRKSELRWLDKWLRNNLWGGLDQVYTDFISVLPEYAVYRFNSKLSAEVARQRWLDLILSADTKQKHPACKTVFLKPDMLTTNKVLRLAPVASNCMIVDISSFTTPKTYEISIKADDERRIRQLHLATVGGQQIQMAAPIKPIPDSNGFISLWRLEMDPTNKQVIIFTNVAKDPALTVRQNIRVEIALSGHLSSVKPKAFTAKKKASNNRGKPRPGPAGARQARELRHQKMQPEPIGAGSTNWEFRPSPEKCRGRVRSRLNCESVTTITLGMTRPPRMGLISSSDMSGGIITGLMGMIPTADVDELARYEDWLTDTPGTHIEIDIPGIDYGFTGTVTDARIRISGGAGTPDLVSNRGTPDNSTRPCSYSQPIGKVSIDEFSIFAIRGSYSAAVIVAGSPRNLSTCPVKPVIKQVTGRFVVAAPFMQDTRTKADLSWLQAEGNNEAMNFVPAGFDMNNIKQLMQHVPQPPTDLHIPSPGGGTETEDWKDVDIKQCACDCNEFRQAMQASQSIMLSGGDPDNKQKRLITCMSLCIAQVADCRL